MNRQERRAARSGHAASRSAAPAARDADIDGLFAAAVRHDRAGEPAQAQQLCRAILAKNPNHLASLVLSGSLAQQAGRNRAAVKTLRKALDIDDGDARVHDTIAMAYQALGQRDEAVRHFSRAIAGGLSGVEELIKRSPAIGACLMRLRGAGVRRMTLGELSGDDGLGAIAEDALLLGLLRTRPVCDLELERFFTALRFALLQRACEENAPGIADAALDLCCALAQQCFINEYVFTFDDAEFDGAQGLSQRVAAQIEAGAELPPFQLAVVAGYVPLHALPVPIASRRWPQALEDLITQQVREPRAEAQDRAAIPELTPIADKTSLEVKQQYEENPFPRWTLAAPVKPTTLEEYARTTLPFAAAERHPGANDFDMLIAGCGTGKHSIERSLLFPQARVLAIDLSRASLAYARRKTREAGLRNIEYRQADILALPSIGRSFDLIEAVGVLHHLAEPATGWRALLSLLRPNGLMAVGLYSAAARRPITALRTAIAERGFAANAADIRTCRQDLINRGQIPPSTDFFYLSGCRDLLFNTMEHQFTIPQIKVFLQENGLAFLGFEQNEDTKRQFRQRYPDAGAIADLDCWHEFELAYPRTFVAMYVFWVQKARG
jgi:2-polyprenyl-3-methyl-5-hydroxy-6-metoxy-1,4-benzoquinol methylase